jgi:hypothetical protein
MACRPIRYLIEGELDNREPGIVTGWLRFVGVKGIVVLSLKGNFHKDIQGMRIRLRGPGRELDRPAAERYLHGFDNQQTGKAGHMTTGLPPSDYVLGQCYLEWYSIQNGRVLMELDRGRVQVIGTPVAPDKAVPVSWEEQEQNLAEYGMGLKAALTGAKISGAFGCYRTEGNSVRLRFNTLKGGG